LLFSKSSVFRQVHEQVNQDEIRASSKVSEG
jgi:hypothetical protein